MTFGATYVKDQKDTMHKITVTEYRENEANICFKDNIWGMKHFMWEILTPEDISLLNLSFSSRNLFRKINCASLQKYWKYEYGNTFFALDFSITF